MQAWQEKLVEQINSLDFKKTMVIVGVCALVLAADVLFIMKAQIGWIISIGPRIAQTKKDIDALQKDLKTRQALTKGTGDFSQAAALSKELVLEEQFPQLLEQISALASANNVKISQINALKDDGKNVKGGAASAKFSATSIVLETVGGYHDFGKFLAELDTLKAIVEVSEMRIVPDPGSSQTQNIGMTLKAYVKK